MKMKRFFETGGALRVVMLAMTLAALAGCSNPGGEGTETLFLVSIRAEAAKTSYIQGEDLDLSTITVAGTYSDGTTKLVAIGEAVIAGYDKNRAGEQTLTVTVEGMTAVITIRVTDDPADAKIILEAALEAARERIAEIVVSEDGSGVPEGVAWVTPGQKAALEEAVEAAREAAASDNAALAELAAAVKALEEAEDAFAAAAETQTGTETAWSYAVVFNANDGEGTDPQTKTVANPATTVGSLPGAPARSGYRFSGWNTRADGSGSAFTGTTPVAADITVYAQWTAVVNARTPVISAQPEDASYTVGGAAAALTVTAASPDGGELSYQWHRASGGSWTAIENATAASYTPPTDAAGTFGYYVRVTNTNNNVNGTKTAAANSESATVTVSPAAVTNAQAPVISIQPESAAYTAGQTAAALTVTAASPDGGELSYQWHRASDGSWTAIENATAASYTPPTDATGTFSYYVRVTNTNNEVNGTTTAAANSGVATVTVTAASIINARAPVISVQPKGASYTVGQTAAALSVTAESPDGGTLSYQWHSSAGIGSPWTAIDGAVESSYTPPTGAAGVFGYYVRVTNTNNEVNGTKTAAANSGSATVTVTAVNARAPVISVQPQDATYPINGTATALSVTAASPDGGVLSYQWHSRASGAAQWTAINSATAASYTPPTAEYGSVSYYVRVTNTNTGVSGATTAASNSDAAVITVARVNAGAPVIKVQPQSWGYLPGATATLSVTAESPDGGTLSYQWHSRADSAAQWTAIDGATGASYNPPTAALGTLYYYAAITNTNTAVDGVTTAARNSSVAAVTIATTGTGSFVFAAWVNEDRSLVSDMPDYFDISQSAGESLVITAAEGLANIRWSLNSLDLPAPRGTAQSITIDARSYGIGSLTLGLYAEKEGIPYSINFTIVVDF